MITFGQWKDRISNMRVISLFSGAGGLDKGLVLANNTIVWANDIDKDAVATYKKNIGSDIVCGDINDLDFSAVPDADVVVGGFPCQGFSVANMRRSVDDGRNQLYKSFLRMVVEKCPKYFIAENVRGILNLGKGAVISAIVTDFEKAGYLVTVNLVNMADFGVPQTRRRVIILGQRRDLGNEMRLAIPPKTNSDKSSDGLPGWVSIKEAIGHFPEPGDNCGIPNHVASSYKVSFRNFTGHRHTDPDKPSPTILARGNGKGGVVAIPHYNGERRLTIRESASIQTFPEDFEFVGKKNSCYRQIGNAVPVKFAKMLGEELKSLENK